MPYGRNVYGGDFWGTDMNTTGFMGFVDNLWVLLNRIFTIVFLIMILLVIVLAIVGWEPMKRAISSDTATFRLRK